MRTLLFGEQTILEKPVEYYLLAEDYGDYNENYGVQVTNEEGEAHIQGISLSQRKIVSLLQSLMKNTVTPITLRDVVEDWVLS